MIRQKFLAVNLNLPFNNIMSFHPGLVPICSLNCTLCQLCTYSFKFPIW